ncbi:hypothetical protein UFOVP606_51 [uncultured Caudovirales phage]|uniref:DUF5681 domain-containing protein n=1 Tax=uncultured Caudovirales phage TaxID=2100421 RepID=A0A6J5N3D6_9CAUD|nr:hypothetical protein UFOVP606_51 [uncultured Caudovirales phage]
MAVKKESLENLKKGKKWQKGESGNPNGAPKKIPELEKMLIDIMGEEVNGIPAALIVLRALRKKAANGDVRAIELLLDRSYGKIKQVIEQTNIEQPLFPDESL